MPGEWGWGRWTPGILWRAYRIESERTSDSGSLPCHGFLPQNRRKCAFFKKVIRRQEIVVCVGVFWDAQKSHSYPSHCKASSALVIYRQLRTWLSLSFPNSHSLCCFSFLHFFYFFQKRVTVRLASNTLFQFLCLLAGFVGCFRVYIMESAYISMVVLHYIHPISYLSVY